MLLGGLQKLSLIDYPGKISCTVFLIGCNFRCPWCYSSELVLPEKIRKQPKISEKSFFQFLKKRKDLLEGVCICGGEPTINKDLPMFIKKIKKMGFLVKLDTNGSNPEMLEKLINDNLIDYVAMDIKVPKEKYTNSVGVKINVQKIQKSIDILKNGKIDYEFRSTILPKVHTKKDIIDMAKWVQGAKAYYLQQFRPEKTLDPEYEKYKPYSEKEINEIKETISPFFKTCQVRL